MYIFDSHDESGEDQVYSEFPALDLNDLINKYEFESFALVESMSNEVSKSLTNNLSNVLVKMLVNFCLFILFKGFYYFLCYVVLYLACFLTGIICNS